MLGVPVAISTGERIIKGRVPKTKLESMDKFVDTFENWEQSIFNYFSPRKITNGMVYPHSLDELVVLAEPQCVCPRETSCFGHFNLGQAGAYNG